MRRRALVLAVAAGCLLGTSAVAAPNPSGRYLGRTVQGIRVRLGPPAGRLWTFRYRARLRCTDGSSFLDRYFSDQVRLRGGAFRNRFAAHRGAVKTWVSGRIRGQRAAGTIHILERYSEVADQHGITPLDPNGAIVCDSGTVAWHAKLA